MVSPWFDAFLSKFNYVTHEDTRSKGGSKINEENGGEVVIAAPFVKK